jgi:hypothetical protein
MDIRDAVVKEIARLNAVLRLLDGGSAGATRVQNRRRKGVGHTMSKAARAKIAAAQRARWAKLRKGKAS